MDVDNDEDGEGGHGQADPGAQQGGAAQGGARPLRALRLRLRLRAAAVICIELCPYVVEGAQEVRRAVVARHGRLGRLQLRPGAPDQRADLLLRVRVALPAPPAVLLGARVLRVRALRRPPPQLRQRHLLQLALGLLVGVLSPPVQGVEDVGPVVDLGVLERAVDLVAGDVGAVPAAAERLHVEEVAVGRALALAVALGGLAAATLVAVEAVSGPLEGVEEDLLALGGGDGLLGFSERRVVRRAVRRAVRRVVRRAAMARRAARGAGGRGAGGRGAGGALGLRGQTGAAVGLGVEVVAVVVAELQQPPRPVRVRCLRVWL